MRSIGMNAFLRCSHTHQAMLARSSMLARWVAKVLYFSRQAQVSRKPNPTCHKPVPGAVALAFAFHTGSNARSPHIRKCCWMAVTSMTVCLCASGKCSL